MNDIESEVIGNAFRLPLPTFVPRRYQPGALANWSGHLAFANDLIAEHRPAILVELGTHYGESYFGMCQSVMENGVDCVCYAVDHWLGEEHAGTYGEEVFAEVNEHNQRFYKSFSYLLRMSFDDALGQFSDNSIDILHIDGLHTYEAGSHDFQSWLPRVRPGGIVLLHDVMVRHANFGIWKMWEELQAEYPETFAFHHSWGLGVMRKPGTEKRDSKLLDPLFSTSRAVHEEIRRHYVLYGSYVERLLVETVAAPPPAAEGNKPQPVFERTLCQLFLPEERGYSESASLPVELPFGDWKTLEFDLPSGLAGSIRIDPADSPCVLEIGSVELVDTFAGTELWAARTSAELRALPVAKTAVVLPGADSYLLFSYGTDPQLFLPDFRHDGPLRLKIHMRGHADFKSLAKDLLPGLTTMTANVAGLVSQAPISEFRSKPIRVQLYPSFGQEYSEADSVSESAQNGIWNTLSFELGPGSMQGPIRFDPADTECLVEIAELEITDIVSGKALLSWRGASELKRFDLIHSAIYVPVTDRCLVFCFGPDSRLEFNPKIDFAGAVLVKCSMKVDTEMTSAADLFKEALMRMVTESKVSAEAEILKSELRASQSYRLLLASELSQSATEKNALIREKSEKQEVFREIQKRAQELEELLAQVKQRSEDERKAFLSANNALSSENDRLTALLRSVEVSSSWRLTKPIRGVMSALRGGKSS